MRDIIRVYKSTIFIVGGMILSILIFLHFSKNITDVAMDNKVYKEQAYEAAKIRAGYKKGYDCGR